MPFFNRFVWTSMLYIASFCCILISFDLLKWNVKSERKSNSKWRKFYDPKLHTMLFGSDLIVLWHHHNHFLSLLFLYLPLFLYISKFRLSYRKNFFYVPHHDIEFSLLLSLFGWLWLLTKKAIISYLSLFSPIENSFSRSLSLSLSQVFLMCHKVFRYCIMIALDNRHWWWFFANSTTMIKRRQTAKASSQCHELMQ